MCFRVDYFLCCYPLEKGAKAIGKYDFVIVLILLAEGIVSSLVAATNLRYSGGHPSPFLAAPITCSAAVIITTAASVVIHHGLYRTERRFWTRFCVDWIIFTVLELIVFFVGIIAVSLRGWRERSYKVPTEFLERQSFLVGMQRVLLVVRFVVFLLACHATSNHFFCHFVDAWEVEMF